MENRTVLTIEDNELNRKLIKALLQRGPYNILEAADAERGIQLAREHGPDLILMDIQLPGMDGLSATRIIKEDPALKGTPVIALTSYAMEGDAEKAKRAGCDGYISKPVNTRNFLDSIKTFFRDDHETESSVGKGAVRKDYLDGLKGRYETPLYTAITDKLTGLNNRAYLKYFLELEIKRSQRHKYPLALIMIDIDNFKEFNETLGHLAGDAIVRELGRLIRFNFREIDFVARYEEDKFAILLSYCDGTGAGNSAERFQQSINAHSFLRGTDWSPMKVRVSIGIAEASANLSSTEELIQRADGALYRAKKEEKDRVCINP